MSPDRSPRADAVSRTLSDVRRGEEAARERLWDLLYDELHDIASRLMRSERRGHTLQPTVLVHEAWLRLFGDATPGLEDRRRFLAAAAVSMRRVLVDHARRRNAAKRGGGAARVTLSGRAAPEGADTVDLVALNAALDRLEEAGGRHVRIVECRYFGGLTIEETAEELGVGITTVKDEWAFARAWLHRELSSG